MLDSNRNSQDDQIIARRKAARMLIAIVIMFGICYLPVHIMNILRYFHVQPPEHDNMIIQTLISHWLPYFNSAINPIIYNFMSAHFRKEFKAACFCAFGKRSRRSVIYTYRTNYHSPKFRKEFKVSCFCCFYGIKRRPRTRRDPAFTMTFSHSNYSNCHTEEVTMATPHSKSVSQFPCANSTPAPHSKSVSQFPCANSAPAPHSNPQQGDLRLSGLPPGQGTGGGARTRHRMAQCSLRVTYVWGVVMYEASQSLVQLVKQKLLEVT
ncbi:orexin receptor type 2 [Plakobranchus ocellatus]|uniref:Orexin receptor type 2 n=1 Tax=Plakobranchus ocellatus TaxID=259542 RepID=A0AAV4BVI1_9GAST|nr:orexin receptor type 2 [Plakobranchus ocellatus]